LTRLAAMTKTREQRTRHHYRAAASGSGDGITIMRLISDQVLIRCAGIESS